MSILRAKDSFCAEYNGAPKVIQRRQTIDSEHPIAKKYPHLFETLTADIKVEQATDEPGEFRHVIPGGIAEVDPEDYTGEQLKRLARAEGVRDYGSKTDIAAAINYKRRHKG